MPSNSCCRCIVRALVSQTHVSRCLIILGQRRRFHQSPRGGSRSVGKERKKKEDIGETERDENVRRTSIHGGVRGRALSTYLPNASPAFRPAHDLRTGWAKDGLDFVLLTFSSDKHSVRRDWPPPRSYWRESEYFERPRCMLQLRVW